MNLQFHLPVNIVFGCGKVAEVGKLTKCRGRKALIVTGRSAQRSGLYGRVCDLLRENGIESVLFDKVTPNPLTTTAEEGAALAKAEGCDVVVAIGGGSVMDCAKGIAFLAENDGDINDYIFNLRRSDRSLPLILIPTTCGTGSEGNGFAVLTNPETHDKKSLRCPAIIAKVSIVDPECMMGMPKDILASVGFAALCHCIEAYTSRLAQPFTDALSLQGISYIAEALPLLCAGENSRELWEELTLASTIGGMVIGCAGVTLAHGMEHPASGLRDIVHGCGLSALTPAVVEATCGGEPGKFALISRLLGGSSEWDCAARIRRLCKQLNLPLHLGELGILASDIPWMVENAQKVCPANIANTYFPVTPEKIEEIYHSAM
ncbi:MAG: iron-containing alcohol dehydrogenase [Oscillospiraceae bacterium]|nr:iron-containing alcohol dehydrogenase [Oscillospiraceae bacterium]